LQEEKPFFVDLFTSQLSKCRPAQDAQVVALQQQTLNKKPKVLMKYAIVIELVKFVDLGDWIDNFLLLTSGPRKFSKIKVCKVSYFHSDATTCFKLKS
jgi:hypothetical protein